MLTSDDLQSSIHLAPLELYSDGHLLMICNHSLSDYKSFPDGFGIANPEKPFTAHSELYSECRLLMICNHRKAQKTYLCPFWQKSFCPFIQPTKTNEGSFPII
jgi:hypothetical protein